MKREYDRGKIVYLATIALGALLLWDTALYWWFSSTSCRTRSQPGAPEAVRQAKSWLKEKEAEVM